jgi:hypothetical protein
MGRPPLRRRAAARAAVIRSSWQVPAEAMEPRLLLSAAAASRGSLAKIGTTLAADAVGSAGAVAVDAYATTGDGATLARAERRLGATGVTRHGRDVFAEVPATSLAALAGLRSLRFARPDDLVTRAGAVTSQGDVADDAANARSTYGINGSGVTVGILSDSFNNSGDADTYATDVASGDLPSGVQILDEDPTTGTDEGRAMAQVIYDSAPGAKLAFATAEGGQATMAANIAALVKAGAKVIVDDVSYLAEPMFQDGPVAQAVAAAVAQGVSYFTAAGQTDSDGYASNWQSGPTLAAGAIPSATGAPAFYGGTLFNFATDGTVNPYNAFTLAAGASITLSFQWDSPYYSVTGGAGDTNQVDAYVFNANDTEVVGGGVNYDVGGDPVQVFTYTNTTGAPATFNLALATEAGSALPGYVKYVDFAGQATGWTYGPNSGTIFGHANAAPAGAGLEAVGAAYYGQTPAFGTTPAVLEPTSATGTTPIFFDTSGNRLATPAVRQSPGLVAPDGVDTTFFGSADTDGDGYPNFFGTSAAAASAAGVAALVLSKVPTLSPAALDNALQSTALDMGAAGVDTQSGYGLIQADAAIAAALNATTGTVTGTVFVDDNGDGTLESGEPGYSGGATVFVDANKNGTLDAGELSTTAATDGTFALTGVPVGSAVVIRVVLPNGYVATAASRAVAVTAGATTAVVNLGLFPDAFSGTGGNDSYLLQVDPTTKTKVDVILGGTTMSVALSLLPSLLFDPGAGNDTLTISYLNGSPMPTGGLSYDGGAGTNGLVIDGTTGADNVTVKQQQTTVNFTAAIQAVNAATETVNGDGGNDSINVEVAPTTGEAVIVNGGVGTTSLYYKGQLPNNGAGYAFNAGTAAGDYGTLYVQGGTYNLAGDPGVTSANLTLNVSTATVVLAAAAAGTGVNARNFAGIVVGTSGVLDVAAPPTHGDRAVVVTNSLSIAARAKMDLAGNDMVVQQGVLSIVTALAATGYAAGAWNGTGLASSAAAADTTHTTALGVIANSASLYNSTNLFDGLVAPAPAAVLVRYTYYGDTNLDGTVNVGDYTRVDAGFISAGQLTGWANGDFNYDNVIDGSDYTLMDNAFNTAPGPL